MTVTRTPITPLHGGSQSIVLIREHMEDALSAFENSQNGTPMEKGYENRMRTFIFNFLHDNVPALWRLFNGGSHIYYGSGYYQADMLIGEPGIPLANELFFTFRGNQCVLGDIIEWGHDHAWSIKGCVNKPLADFVKWFILFDPTGLYQFNPLPLCCFQIATDFNGQNLPSVNQIEQAFRSLNFLADIWEIDYAPNPAHAYIFMNYFPAGTDFHSLLGSLPNPFYPNDLAANYRGYYQNKKGWPITLSIDHGISALDAIV